MSDEAHLNSYIIAAVHSCRYPTQDVLGVLLGEDTVTDAIPLFHTTPTTPMIEVALQLLSDKPVIGFYEARIRGAEEGNEISGLIRQLCNALQVKTGKKVYALSVSSNWSQHNPFTLYRKEARGQFVKVGDSVTEQAMAQIQDILKGYPRIQDFDDHLEDPSVDFINSLGNYQGLDLM